MVKDSWNKFTIVLVRKYKVMWTGTQAWPSDYYWREQWSKNVMRPQDDRSQQSSLSLCDQDSGIRQSRQKIPHSDCSLQKTFNSCPVRSTGEAPPGWRGVQKTCQGGCSCHFMKRGFG